MWPGDRVADSLVVSGRGGVGARAMADKNVCRGLSGVIWVKMALADPGVPSKEDRSGTSW